MKTSQVSGNSSKFRRETVLASAGSWVRTWHVLFLLTAVFVGLGLIYSNFRGTVDVVVAAPAFRDIQSSVSTMGKVVPARDYQARATASGTLEGIYVHLGQQVAPGQLLVRIKDPFAPSRVASAAAALQSVEVSYENVRSNGSREDHINFAADYKHAKMEQESAATAVSTLKYLKGEGSASGAELYGAQQRLLGANATMQALESKGHDRYSPKDVASWEARVAEAKAALKAERSNLANTQITSAVSGTVYLIPVLPYDVVPAGAELVRVADLSKLEVRALFDEPEIGRLAVGQPVTLKWDGKPDTTWHGRVQTVPMAVVNSGSRSVGESIITIDSATGDLPANTSINVTVTTGNKPHVLTIPREALHIDGAVSYAYRDVAGRLIKTPVEIGMVNLNDAEITKGLSPTDIVALHALTGQELRENLKVAETR